MRILISAFSCQPGKGSEPGVGWGVVTQAARRHHVLVLTDAHNWPAIRQWRLQDGTTRAHFVVVRLPISYGWVHRWKAFTYAYYTLWQLKAFLIARRFQRRLKFDLVHHVTFVNSWAPTFMGYLGIPFVWSAGAMDTVPWRFFSILSWRSRLSEMCRTFTIRFLGAVVGRLCRTRASIILTSSANAEPRRNPQIKQMPLGALSLDELRIFNSLPGRPQAPFRIASVGNLFGGKGFALGILAFARLLRQYPDSEYWVIGEGPERTKLENLARKEGCAHKVRFLGWRPREAIPQLLGQIDVLVHPSLHEQFGYVVLEAMAARRPVVCLDVGGCGYLVKSGGGVAIPVGTIEEVVSKLHLTLAELRSDPTVRLQIVSKAAQAVLDRWNWPAVGRQLEMIYQKASKAATGNHGDLAATGMHA